MRVKFRSLYLAFLLAFFSAIQPCKAAGLLDGGLLALDPAELAALIPANTVNALVKTVGLWTQHRPFQGASILGGTTDKADAHFFEFGFGINVMKFQPILLEALAADGLMDSDNVGDYPGLPMVKFNFAAAFLNRFQLTTSAFYYPPTNYILGGDIQTILWDLGEGPIVSGRFGYTYLDLPLAYTSINTFSPAILVGRPMSFADPYIGIQYTYMAGKMEITLDQPPIPIIKVTAGGKGESWSAMTGVVFRMPILRLALEGSYNLDGFHTLGLLLGFGI